MALGMYYKQYDVYLRVSQDTELTNPVTTSHDGKNGDTQTVQLYIRNDDDTKWYSNIIITPVDLVDAEPYGDVVHSETGWGVKLSKGATEPTSGQWDDIAWGNSVTMDDVGSDSAGDINTYYSFWYLISCPPNIDAQVKTDIVLNVSETENAVI